LDSVDDEFFYLCKMQVTRSKDNHAESPVFMREDQFAEIQIVREKDSLGLDGVGEHRIVCGRNRTVERRREDIETEQLEPTDDPVRKIQVGKELH
jgi:hypothetical protein